MEEETRRREWRGKWARRWMYRRGEGVERWKRKKRNCS
jgi:hypothetical protein